MTHDSYLIFEAYLNETRKETKQYVASGKLDPETAQKIIEADPHPKKTYSGWMARQIMQGNVDINNLDDLRNTVEEFHTFLQRRLTSKLNLAEYKTFQELQDEINTLNSTGSNISNKQDQSDFEVIVDTDDLYVAVPHSHAAARKLGVSLFSRRSCGLGDEDSKWCITYKNPDHWNDYYFNKRYTFYLILIKSERLLNQLLEAGFPRTWKTIALLVEEDGTLKEVYDSNDAVTKDREKIMQYLQIIGLK